MAGTPAGGGSKRRRPDAEVPEEVRPAPPERCSACRSGALTRLPMLLADGTDVLFVSCQACEQREWLQPRPDGGWQALPIDSVLQRSARRR